MGLSQYVALNSFLDFFIQKNYPEQFKVLNAGHYYSFIKTGNELQINACEQRTNKVLTLLTMKYFVVSKNKGLGAMYVPDVSGVVDNGLVKAFQTMVSLAKTR